MHLFGERGGTRRTVSYGLLGTLALLVPIVLGFAVASASESRPPQPGETVATQASSVDRVVDTTQQQVATQAPIGDAPSTAEEALTRQDEAVAGIPRLRYTTPATGEVRLNSGDVIPLGNDVVLTIEMTPFPPTTFDIELDLSLSQNGVPITDAVIDTQWDMIVMGHGPFETRIPHVTDGLYSTSYDFFMFGPWQLDTEIQISGADPLEFAISVYVWPL